MKIRTLLGFALLLLSPAVAAPAAAEQGRAAQPARERFDCDRMGGLQCQAESRAQLLALYGLPTAESRLAAGSDMYRVFIFNAWMRHQVAITVERAPGEAPTLTLHAPPRPGGEGAAARAAAPVSVPLSLDDWYTVTRRGWNFHRVMVPEPVAPGVISICSGHGPLYFVEAANPHPDADQPLRRSGLGGCQQGLAEPFAIDVALLAADTIPSCALLRETDFTFTAELLAACASFSGDRLAAAEVYNAMRPLLAGERDRPSEDQLETLFGMAELEGAAAGAKPERVWLDAFAGEERTMFVVESVHARGPDHASVEGVLRRRHLVDEQGDRARDRIEEAPVRIVWERSSSDLEIRRIAIGPFAQVPDRCVPGDRTLRAADC